MLERKIFEIINKLETENFLIKRLSINPSFIGTIEIEFFDKKELKIIISKNKEINIHYNKELIKIKGINTGIFIHKLIFILFPFK